MPQTTNLIPPAPSPSYLEACILDSQLIWWIQPFLIAIVRAQCTQKSLTTYQSSFEALAKFVIRLVDPLFYSSDKMRSKKVVAKKRKKPNDAPKQPLTPYLEFAKDERPKIYEEVGKLSLTAMGKELGKRWKCFASSEKAVYEEKGKMNREKYKEKVHQYNLDHACECDEPSGKELSSVIDVDNSSSEVHVENLGFAKEKGYPWHPALWCSSFLNGNRVVVAFLGTGQRVTVDKANWMSFSDDT